MLQPSTTGCHGFTCVLYLPLHLSSFPPNLALVPSSPPPLLPSSLPSPFPLCPVSSSSSFLFSLISLHFIPTISPSFQSFVSTTLNSFPFFEASSHQLLGWGWLGECSLLSLQRAFCPPSVASSLIEIQTQLFKKQTLFIF